MKLAALQNISSFTLLASPTKINDLLFNAEKKGYQAVALTDVNVTYGLVDFYKKAQATNVKPLLGMTVRLNGLVDSTQKFDLLVLARNSAGYRNLLRLSSAINLMTDNGESEKIVTLKEVKKYFSDFDLIIPANRKSELLMLFRQNEKLGSEYIRDLQQIQGPNCNLFLGVYANSQLQDYIAYLQSLSKQFHLPLVATEDCQYLEPQDHFLRKTLLAIKKGEKLKDVTLLAKQKGSHYLASSEEIGSRYHDFALDQALSNTWQIADECNAAVTFQKPVLPKYRQNHFSTSKEYLHYLTQKGIEQRFHRGRVPANYQARLNYELSVINQMGFDDYFLIVWDVINYCHRAGITTGPGRGSACGSLVSYALQITQVDPLKYHLLFERFLNPYRHEMPDIDLDIPDNRRDDVIKYMFNKYGMNHAAQILTFGTLAAKQALRDVGRVFGLTMAEMNRWASAVPYSKGKISLNEAYQESRELRILVSATPQNKLLFQTARALENLPRHYSIHAAGLVISDHSIAKISGMQTGPLGIPVTQQTKKYVESLGLLKIDFLGLRNLTVLGQALALVKKQGTALDPKRINLNDKATLKLFQAGKTDSVFQFESQGIRRVLRALHPDDFNDLVAVNALYRPGPMKNIPTFIARKKGKEPVKYPDPSLKGILRPTYGILVYQEQVMQTAQILAGFSLGEADLLRRAMSKKQPQLIEKERNKFIKGAVKKGRPEAVAENVYHYIEQFANYGFNKSHAVAYTTIAFWLAYLKVHYPAAFYTALLNSSGANKNKAAAYVMSAQEAGVKLLGPNINLSKADYTLRQGHILIGLKAIKGLRADFIQEIVTLSKPFASLTDFLRKIDGKFLQADSIKTLIKAGCFDWDDKNRKKLLANVPDMIENVQLTGENLSLSKSLGGAPLKDVSALTTAEKSQMEEEVLGFTVSANPLVTVEKYAQKFNGKALADFDINENGIGVGKLISLKIIKTKNKRNMAFASFADTSSRVEMVIFPNLFEKIHAVLRPGSIYLLGLKIQSDRFDSAKKQYIVTNLKKVNLKE